MRRFWIISSFLLFFLTPFLFAESSSQISKPTEGSFNPFAQQFCMTPSQKLENKVAEAGGLIFIDRGDRSYGSRYAVVTNFGKGIVKTQNIPGINNVTDLQKWIKTNLKTSDFQGVDIKELTLPSANQKEKKYYWIGQKSFASAEAASAEIAMFQTMVEQSEGNFSQMISEAKDCAKVVEIEEPVIEIKSPAQYQREEELVLNYMEKIDFGEKLFGPFQGTATGEQIIWQSFGETTWRLTNLESKHFDSQVVFWTNRIVFKGIRFPFNTVDPFVEAIPALESNGVDYKSNMKLFAGLEWRPFARTAWTYNFRPWGGIALLEFIRNYRVYVQYGDRKNLKDEITGSANYDMLAGVSIFYEWGVELPPLEEPAPKKFSEYVEKYVWGEYFGDYRYERTNFSAEDDYNSMIWNSSVILGIKLPGIPVPDNMITDEIVLMPYMRFEHTNATEISFAYQNRYFVAAGLRWMPFRNYRYKENEWLSKMKVFGEWVGVGRVQNAKQDGEAPYAIDYDLRFGLSFSSRRF